MLLTNVALVLPDRTVARGTLHVAGGVIADIEEADGPPSPVTVMPGFVDLHGDMIEVEVEPRPGVDFPMPVALSALDTRLAAAGVTTAFAAVSYSRGATQGRPRSLTHTDTLIRAMHAARDTARVDHRIHARFDITNTEAIASLEGLLADGLIDLVSVMDHTPGQGQYRDIERHIALRAAGRGIPLAEARATVQADIDAATPEADVLDNLRTVSALCRQHSIPLASHDDDTVEKAAFVAQLGAVISEFPVTREAAEAAVAEGLMTAMGAPNAMRGESYSGNLSARDTHDAGMLHILASDYHPHAILPAIRALASADPGGVAAAVQLATANPARAVGLGDRGRIAVGARADLVLVDSRDRVVMTLRGGEVIYTDGSIDPRQTDSSHQR